VQRRCDNPLPAPSSDLVAQVERYLVQGGACVEILGHAQPPAWPSSPGSRPPPVVFRAVSGSISFGVGLPRGLVLVGTSPGGVWENGWVNRIVGAVVNGFRSLLFIILLVAVIPLTRVIVGTSIGTAAAIVPLSISGIPYFGRVSEVALREVDRGLIRYGYQRFETSVMIAVIVVLVAMLAHIQAAVDWLARSVDHR
jgi:ABC-type methionine transport system permease subunit